MLIGLLLALTRLNNGDIPGLRQAIGDALGIDYATMMRDRSVAVDANSLPASLVGTNGSEPIRSAGDVVERLEAIAHKLYERLYETDFDSASVERIATDMLVDTGDVPRVLRYVCESIYPALTQTTDEIDALLRGFDGRFISPGPRWRSDSRYGGASCPPAATSTLWTRAASPLKLRGRLARNSRTRWWNATSRTKANIRSRLASVSGELQPCARTATISRRYSPSSACAQPGRKRAGA